MDQSLTRDISKKKVPTWLTTCPKTRQGKAMHVGQENYMQLRSSKVCIFAVKWSLFSTYYYCLLIVFTNYYGQFVDKIVSLVPNIILNAICKFLLFLIYWLGTYQPWLYVEKRWFPKKDPSLTEKMWE